MLDTLIRNVNIIDGLGNPAFAGDVGIACGAIAAVGQLPEVQAGEVIDGQGRTLTPGLIDIHRHGDGAVFRPGFGSCELAQGLTTVVNGNCGLSAAPMGEKHREELCAYLTPITGELRPEHCFARLGDYLSAVERQGAPIHTAMLAGGGTIRAGAAGFRDEPLSDEEFGKIHRLIEESLSDGAAGISLGLGYAPECFYSTEELIRALAPLRRSGKRITVHMRQEGDGVVPAADEMIAVARALETPVEISHLKAIGRRNWHRAVPEILKRLNRARAEGVDISCDVYPYPAGSTQLIHVLPPEFQKGGTAALTRALADSEQRQTMRRRMETGRDFENITDLVGFENVRATSLKREENRHYEGWSVAEIAQAQGKDPFDALFDLLASEQCGVSMIDFIAEEGDIEEILRTPYAGVISDATYPTSGLLHPRVYGAFPRLLEEYVGRRHVLTLEEAVRKVTSLPAERFGWGNKGRIAVGADADLCLFDPAAIHETGTWQNPACPAQGMERVFVLGRTAFQNGKVTDARAGRVIR